MIEAFLCYIFIGIVFNFLFDLMVNWLSSNDPENENLRFTIFERIFTTLTWPIHLIRLIIGFNSTKK